MSGDASSARRPEVLRMARWGAAEALGLGRKIGSIAPGKLADLCAVSLGDPGKPPCYDPAIAPDQRSQPG